MHKMHNDLEAMHSLKLLLEKGLRADWELLGGCEKEFELHTGPSGEIAQTAGSYWFANLDKALCQPRL